MSRMRPPETDRPDNCPRCYSGEGSPAWMRAYRDVGGRAASGTGGRGGRAASGTSRRGIHLPAARLSSGQAGRVVYSRHSRYAGMTTIINSCVPLFRRIRPHLLFHDSQQAGHAEAERAREDINITEGRLPLFFQHSDRGKLIDSIEARAIALRLNKKELAEKAGLFRQAFYKTRNSDVSETWISTIIGLAKALQVRPDSLLQRLYGKRKFPAVAIEKDASFEK